VHEVKQVSCCEKAFALEGEICQGKIPATIDAESKYIRSDLNEVPAKSLTDF
jgi:hypothetical protein